MASAERSLILRTGLLIELTKPLGSKVGLALAGIALYDGQLSKWDIRKP